MKELGNMEEFMEIEKLLSCPICYEYIDTAMIIPHCSHNYCSLCIRRHISFKTQCPTCNEPVQQQQLCNNRLLDELIHIFKSIIAKLKGGNFDLKGSAPSKHIKQDAVVPPKVATPSKVSVTQSEKISTPKKTWLYSNTPTKLVQAGRCHTPARPGLTAGIQKHSDTDNNDEDVQILSCVMMSPPPDKVQKVNNVSMMLSPPSKSLGSPSSSTSTLRVPRLGDQVDSSSPSNSHKNLPKVGCPICGVLIPEKNINLHLDRCLSRSEVKVTRNTSVQPKRKLMTKYVYTLMKDKELRKKVAESGLPTDGDRHTLIRRHQELTLRYNAQCDSINPKSAQEIVKEITDAEKSKVMFGIKSPKSFKLNITKGETTDQIEEKQQKYVKQHKSQFSQLIAETKRRMKEAKLAESKKKSAENTSGDRNTPESATDGDSRDVQTSCVDNGDRITSVLPETSVSDTSVLHEKVTVPDTSVLPQKVSLSETESVSGTGVLPEAVISLSERSDSSVSVPSDDVCGLTESSSVHRTITAVSDRICVINEPPDTADISDHVTHHRQSHDQADDRLPLGGSAGCEASDHAETDTCDIDNRLLDSDRCISPDICPPPPDMCVTPTSKLPQYPQIQVMPPPRQDMCPTSPSLYSDCASPCSIVSGEFISQRVNSQTIPTIYCDPSTSESTIPYSDTEAGTQPFVTFTEALVHSESHSRGVYARCNSQGSESSSDFSSQPPSTQPGSRYMETNLDPGQGSRLTRASSPSVDDLVAPLSPVLKRVSNAKKRKRQTQESPVVDSTTHAPPVSEPAKRRGRPRLDCTEALQDVPQNIDPARITRRSSRLSQNS